MEKEKKVKQITFAEKEGLIFELEDGTKWTQMFSKNASGALVDMWWQEIKSI